MRMEDLINDTSSLVFLGYGHMSLCRSLSLSYTSFLRRTLHASAVPGWYLQSVVSGVCSSLHLKIAFLCVCAELCLYALELSLVLLAAWFRTN